MMRQIWGAIELEDGGGLLDAANAAWGAFFTTLSFIATVGRESVAWDTAQAWTGLDTPGLLLLGLLSLGGGVASTAGGIKLLRIYALYKHGVREMQRLTLPSSVAGAGQTQRRIRREGAFISWVYLMLFLLSLGVAILVLSLTGIDLISAINLSVVMLSNAGPALGVLSETPMRIADLPVASQLVLCAVMILGRLEVLALFALFDPAFWRR
jgi:trk system potassium uptake protein TrkH